MRLSIFVLISLLVRAVPIFSAEMVWHNGEYGPFHWWSISRTRDGFYLSALGATLNSSNAHDWSLHYQPGDAHLFAIAQSEDKFIAVASQWRGLPHNAGHPALYISTNGIDFKFLEDGPHYMYQIVYGKGQFVGAGYGISRSKNGLDWQKIAMAEGTSSEWGDLLFGGGRFVRITTVGISTSDDGVTWDQTGPGGLRLGYYNGVYVAASETSVSFSDDARHWRTQTFETLRPLRALAIGPPGTVVVGDSLYKPNADALFSADGTNWLRFTLPFGSRPWDIKFINGEYVMVGDSGLIAYSTDGTNWTTKNVSTQVNIESSVKGADRLIAVGSTHSGGGAGIWSSNGVTWQPLNLQTPRPLYSVAHLNGTFVAVGYLGQMAVSTNGGDTWTQPKVTTSDLSEVIVSPRGFVAVGGGSVLTSPDGLTWETVSDFVPRFLDIAYGNGIYIATRSGGWGMSVYRSTDLTNWSALPRPFDTGYEVEFGNGRFVLGPRIFTSTDGTNWVAGSANMYGITFSEGVFGAGVGNQVSGSMRGYVSLDGLRWHEVFEVPPMWLRPARYFGRFLGLGPFCAIGEAVNFGILDLSQNADGSINLQPIHPASLTSQIETSTNLTSWTTLQQPTPVTRSTPEQNFFRLKLSAAPASTE